MYPAFLSQALPIRIVTGDQIPERRGMVHMHRMAKFMHHHMAHQFRLHQQELGVEIDVAFGRTEA